VRALIAWLSACVCVCNAGISYIAGHALAALGQVRFRLAGAAANQLVTSAAAADGGGGYAGDGRRKGRHSAALQVR
jgi:hypothetical protein